MCNIVVTVTTPPQDSGRPPEDDAGPPCSIGMSMVKTMKQVRFGVTATESLLFLLMN